MVKKFFNVIRIFNGASGFEMYLENVQQRSGALAPSRNEAKKDYANLMRRGF